mmetsp:Transcript_107484/g.304556  ORF Transcript_107484/g.304556 Transcript_107484/m.304556 type:complete len:280 (+) Transcript_107484:50-889(+)
MHGEEEARRRARRRRGPRGEDGGGRTPGAPLRLHWVSEGGSRRRGDRAASRHGVDVDEPVEPRGCELVGAAGCEGANAALVRLHHLGLVLFCLQVPDVDVTVEGAAHKLRPAKPGETRHPGSVQGPVDDLLRTTIAHGPDDHLVGRVARGHLVSRGDEPDHGHLAEVALQGCLLHEPVGGASVRHAVEQDLELRARHTAHDPVRPLERHREEAPRAGGHRRRGALDGRGPAPLQGVAGDAVERLLGGGHDQASLRPVQPARAHGELLQVDGTAQRLARL